MRVIIIVTTRAVYVSDISRDGPDGNNVIIITVTKTTKKPRGRGREGGGKAVSSGHAKNAKRTYRGGDDTRRGPAVGGAPWRGGGSGGGGFDGVREPRR